MGSRKHCVSLISSNGVQDILREHFGSVEKSELLLVISLAVRLFSRKLSMGNLKRRTSCGLYLC